MEPSRTLELKNATIAATNCYIWNNWLGLLKNANLLDKGIRPQ